ncbi:MAG: response regulator [Bacillota bacterium]|nr:response regulator [Bacillota bacterium]
MRIIALDDEKIALEGLVDAIREAEPAAEIHSFCKGAKALEFYRQTPCDVAVLDIQVWDMNGVDLAKQMKLINPQVNIIFATGYGDYRAEAFDMHASGYLVKPITPEKIRTEMENLRHPVKQLMKKRVRFHTFGNFEVFIDDKPVKFKYDLTKEMLAYLVDRNGVYCTNGELTALLWEGKQHSSYLRNLKKDLIDSFIQAGCQDVIDSGRNKIRIVPGEADCDYYDWMAGKVNAINQYNGEYMVQYSWAEFTNAALQKKI